MSERIADIYVQVSIMHTVFGASLAVAALRSLRKTF